MKRNNNNKKATPTKTTHCGAPEFEVARERGRRREGLYKIKKEGKERER